MERLPATDDSAYSAIEAAIHVGRYAIALPFADGRRVLDVACGEGYGSWLLARSGAAEVRGVDVAPDAIVRARAAFGGPAVGFEVGDGEALARLYPPGHFDLVVSIETIEHVPDPAAFLEAIREVSAPGAIIILTCPNDHWYYAPEERNPFHLRKYTLAEFQALASGVLGDRVQWLLGSAAFGFSAVPAGTTAPEGAAALPRVVRAEPAGWHLRVPPLCDPVTEHNCSYFVGVWNAPGRVEGAGAFEALSMDAFREMMTGYRQAAQRATGVQHASPRDRVSLAALRCENDILAARVEEVLRDRDALIAGQATLVAERDALAAERNQLLPAALRWRGLTRRARRLSPRLAELAARILRRRLGEG